MSDQPKPHIPVNPEELLDSLSGIDRDSQICALEDVHVELARRLEAARV